MLVEHGGRRRRAGRLRGQPDPRQPRRPRRARRADGRAGHRLHADQGRRAAPRQRRLPRPRRAQAAHAAVRLGGAEARAALARDPHRVARRRRSAWSARCRSSPSRSRSTSRSCWSGERELYYLLHALDPDFARAVQGARPTSRRTSSARRDERRALRAPRRRRSRGASRLRPLDRAAVRARHRARRRALAGDAEQALASRCRTSPTSCARPTTGPAPAAATWSTPADVRARDRGAASGRADARARAHARGDARGHAPDRHRRASASARSTACRSSQLGDLAFGMPDRGSPRACGSAAASVVDIEREVELGGPIHSKGVLILARLPRRALRAGPARSRSRRPSSSSSPTAASRATAPRCAELYALLSALADVPLRQSLAVTGSVNQHGDVQAIGGVNEKIEGFFDVCRRAGSTATQGVIIPAANVQHLMLRARGRRGGRRRAASASTPWHGRRGARDPDRRPGRRARRRRGASRDDSSTPASSSASRPSPSACARSPRRSTDAASQRGGSE